MKVLYDHQTFTGTTFGGVSRYFAELMNQFSKRDDISFDLALRFSNNEYLREAAYTKPIAYRRLANNFRANQFFSLINRRNSILKLQTGDYDLFHPTYYHRYFMNKVNGKPIVLTFHDALSERFGKVYPELGEHLSLLKQQLFNRADAVISVSEASKREMLRYFDVDPAKIRVIHLGNYLNPSLTQPQPNRLKLAERYVLFVGKRDLYKNFDRLFEAMVPIMQKDLDLQFVCAGGGHFTPNESAVFDKNKLSKRVVYRPIHDDATLAELYRRAQLFVFPSLMEGFGLPTLEAMSCGCPVVVSTGTSFTEIAEDAAAYFEPESVDSINYTIEKVLSNSALRQQMRQKGLTRVPLFSAEKTALETLQVYKGLVK
jgi:glycosyltransferase involved in cell wall biosynthesis